MPELKLPTPACKHCQQPGSPYRELLCAVCCLSHDLDQLGIEHQREVKLMTPRKWAWDFMIVRLPIVIEVQGGGFMEKGAHNTGLAIERDCEKAAAIARSGYTSLPFTPAQVRSGMALITIQSVYHGLLATQILAMANFNELTRERLEGERAAYQVPVEDWRLTSKELKARHTANMLAREVQ